MAVVVRWLSPALASGAPSPMGRDLATLCCLSLAESASTFWSGSMALGATCLDVPRPGAWAQCAEAKAALTEVTSVTVVCETVPETPW